jgi:hypothetical protein
MWLLGGCSLPLGQGYGSEFLKTPAMWMIVRSEMFWGTPAAHQEITTSPDRLPRGLQESRLCGKPFSKEKLTEAYGSNS